MDVGSANETAKLVILLGEDDEGIGPMGKFKACVIRSACIATFLVTFVAV